MSGRKTIPVPMVVGHEYVGEVVGIGQEVKGFKIGDRVSGEGHITCGHCRNCRGGRTHLCRNTIGVGVNRPGCFAEYLVIPAFNAFKIPDNISDDGFHFDPFGNAVAYRAVVRSGWRGCAGLWCRSDRYYGCGGGETRWCTQCGDH